MVTYKLLIHGKNFLLKGKTAVTKVGLRATRYVEADSPEGAKQIALNDIKDELTAFLKNEPDDVPILFIPEVQEVAAGVDESDGTGFDFYPEGNKGYDV